MGAAHTDWHALWLPTPMTFTKVYMTVVQECIKSVRSTNYKFYQEHMRALYIALKPRNQENRLVAFKNVCTHSSSLVTGCITLNTIY